MATSPLKLQFVKLDKLLRAKVGGISAENSEVAPLLKE